MLFKDIFRRVGKDKVLTYPGVRDFAAISRRLQKPCVNGKAQLNVVEPRKIH